MDITIAKFPRIEDEEGVYCQDDCVATIAKAFGRDYELMYLQMFQINFVYQKHLNCKIGENLAFKFPNRDENLYKFHGIHLNNINVRDQQQKSLEMIREQHALGKPVLIYFNPFWCHWDFEFQMTSDEKEGHEILVVDLTDEGVVCIDPYFVKMHEVIPYDHFVKGILNVVLIDVENQPVFSDDEYYQYLRESIRDIRDNHTIDQLWCLCDNFCKCENIFAEVPNDMSRDISKNAPYWKIPLTSKLMFLNHGFSYYALAVKKLSSYLSVPDERLENLADRLWDVCVRLRQFRRHLSKMFIAPHRYEKLKEQADTKMKYVISEFEAIINVLEDLCRYQQFVCPTCHERLCYQEDHLTCEKCNVEYPIEDGIPVMFCEDYNNRYSKLYVQMNQLYDSTKEGRFITFMNYGYENLQDDLEEPFVVQKSKINKNSVRLVARLLENYTNKPKQILDIGCGRGGEMKILSKMFPQANLLGIDPCKEGLLATKKSKCPGEYVNGDALKVPLKDHSVDLIVCVEVFHAITEASAFICEMKRLLRKNGVLLIADLFRDATMEEISQYCKEHQLSLKQNKDVTANILQSMEELTDIRFVRHIDVNEPVQDKVEKSGAAGSEIYRQLKEKEIAYRFLTIIQEE